MSDAGDGGWSIINSGAIQLYREFCATLVETILCRPMSALVLQQKLIIKEGNVLFNDTLNTFYLRLYGVRHMVKNHSDSERGNLLPSHALLFPINSKGSFICTIPQTG